MAVFTNDPPRTLMHRTFYRFIQWFTLCIFKIVYRLQVRHVDRLPMTGGALICLNHCSHLDPMAFGCIAPRRVNFLAKRSLLDSKLTGRILFALDCIAIDRETSGIGGMKETLKRLKKGESVVLFPEGERSFDGNMLPLMTGFTALVKRVKVPIVPVGIHGTYDAFPRGASMPKFGRIKLVVGKPIPFTEMEQMSGQEMADHVGKQIAKCFQEAREWNT